MTRNEIFSQIASDHLHIGTLQTRNSDELDFHDCSVWGIKAALEAAYDAGLRQRKQARQVIKHPADGTCYIGSIKASYAGLVEIFGKPSEGDGFKTEAHWLVMLPRKEVATIYNYKNSRSYSPDFPLIEAISEWHIGGHRGSALDALINKLGAKATLIDRVK
jgi:hypothetical protein